MDDDLQDPAFGAKAKPRKPRLVLMGEFSAGKSTLTNVLLKSAPLPMRVTATRLPPVQISHGTPAAFAIAMDGERTEIDLSDLEAVSLDDTLLIEIFMHSSVLELCDIVDMPGISDPSMPREFWQGVLDSSDHVIWCTHATQAWRQSEAAVWETMYKGTSGRNVLLITQFDKLQNDRDKDRVLKRVRHETQGLFEAVFPVTLLDALTAPNNELVWERSGAAAFSEHVIKVLMEKSAGSAAVAAGAAALSGNDLRNITAVRAQAEKMDVQQSIAPRRIRPGSASLRPADRPIRSAVTAAE